MVDSLKPTEPTTEPTDAAEQNHVAPGHWLSTPGFDVRTDFVPRVDSHAERPDHKKRNRRAIAITAISSLLLGGGLAVWGISSSNHGPKPSATVSAPLNPSGSPSPSASETAPDPQFAGEVLVQKTTVAEMDKMDIKSFANLPYADRLAYSLAKAPGAEQAYEKMDDKFVLAHPTYITGYWDGIRSQAVGESNPDVGAKIEAGYLYYTVDSDGNLNPAYQTRVDEIEQAGGSHTLGDQSTYVSSTELAPGVDESGSPIDVMNFTYYDSDTQSGDKRGPDTTANVIRTQVKLLDGTTIIYYAQGYAAN